MAGDRRHPLQFGHSCVLSTAPSGGVGQEGGANGVHAQIAGHLKRDAETSEAVASGCGNGVCPSIGEHGLDGDRGS